MARYFVSVIGLVALVAVHAPMPSAVGQVEASRAEAAALRSKIEEHGRALSMADEDLNEARIERERLETQAATARAEVAAAADRWDATRTRLSKRARLIYMHPGAALDAWLGQAFMTDTARAQKLGSEVLIADAEIVTRAEKARREVLARARRLDGLRDHAGAKERELVVRQAEVSSALAEQRNLLRSVTDEIANLIQEQRERELAQARHDHAAEAQPTGASGSPQISASSPSPATEGDGQADSQSVSDPVGPPPPVKPGAGKAVAVAAAQIGKPYEWAGAGPDTFDCSGLAMYAWAAAGVSLVHSSRAQYASLPHVARSQLQPGDLVFYGDPIHHMGIYEGGGVMINAPETGEFVRRDSIARADWAGAARP